MDKPAVAMTSDPPATAARTLLESRQLPRWAAPVAVGAVALAGAGVLAFGDPGAVSAVWPGCPFRLLTGLDCPGCGGTRAAIALLNGQVLRALDHNVVTVVLMPVLGWGWWRWLKARMRRGSLPTVPPRWSMGLAVVLTVFWVLRNVPMLGFLGSQASWSV